MMSASSSPTTSSNHRPNVKALLVLAAVACLGVIARYNLRGDISSQPLRISTSYNDNYELLDTSGPLDRLNTKNVAEQQTRETNNDNDYFVFLQKFPLQNTWQMIFHTEVVVCPRKSFHNDADFLSTLDQLLAETLSPTTDAPSNDSTKVPFVQVPEEKWTKQSNSKCVQLGYGGAACPSACCGSPHGNDNTNYALNSRHAVIGNAMGDAKQLFLYGASDSINGMDAYRAVCGGSTTKAMPTCVSKWAGTDYNPLTNNCNTFTSTILKCVYGLSDAKPNLGISDMVNVACPMEKRDDGMDVQQCLISEMTTSLSDAADEVMADVKKEE